MKLSAQVGSEERDIIVEPATDNTWRVVVNGVERLIDARRVAPGTWSLLLDGETWLVDLDPGKDGDLIAEVRGQTIPVKLMDARRKLLAQAKARTAGQATSGPLVVRAPMPGKVAKILVKAGDSVTSGQGIVIVEAMKMENELKAPRDGAIAQIHVAEGQTVEAQEALITLG